MEYFWIVIWCVVGMFCIINNWRSALDVKTRDMPMLLFAGMTIGPVIGVFDLIYKITANIRPRKFMSKILIKGKSS